MNKKNEILLDEISWFFYKKFTNPTIAFFESVKRSLFWAKKMWKNYDFDAVYLMEMDIAKLERMEKIFREGHLEGCNEHADEIAYAISIGLQSLDLFHNHITEQDLVKAQALSLEFYTIIGKNLFNWWD